MNDVIIFNKYVFIFSRFGQCQKFMKVLDEISFVVKKGTEISMKFPIGNFTINKLHIPRIR
jgi:hypothetical protein